MISFVCSWFRKSFLVFPKNCHKLPNYSNLNVKCKLVEIKMVNVFDYWHTFAMLRLIFFSPLRCFVNSVVENGKAYASARRWHRPFSSWKRKVHFWKTMHSKKAQRYCSGRIHGIKMKAAVAGWHWPLHDASIHCNDSYAQ